MSNAHHRWLVYLPAAFVAVIIAVLSLMENPQGLLPVTTSDKISHGIAYGLLALSLVFAMEYKCPSAIRHYVFVLILTIGYGGLMECLQYLCTTTRTAEWSDLGADTLGAIIGLLLFLPFYRK